MTTDVSASRPAGFDRRSFLRVGVGAAAASVPFHALAARTASATPAKLDLGAGYGPLSPVKGQTTGLELLALPRGFEYLFPTGGPTT